MFNRYTLLAGYDDNYLPRKYKNGLNKALHQKVIGTYPAPVDLEQWKERALALDKEFRRENNKNKDKDTYKTPIHRPIPKRDDNAMEIDAISTTTANAPKCSHCKNIGKNNNHPESQCRRKLGLCLICGGKHSMNECVNKKDAQKPTRRINFATKSKASPAEETGNHIQNLLDSLEEDDYNKVASRFATGF